MGNHTDTTARKKISTNKFKTLAKCKIKKLHKVEGYMVNPRTLLTLPLKPEFIYGLKNNYFPIM